MADATSNERLRGSWILIIMDCMRGQECVEFGIGYGVVFMVTTVIILALKLKDFILKKVKNAVMNRLEQW